MRRLWMIVAVFLLMVPVAAQTEQISITEEAFNAAAQNWQINGVESVLVELEDAVILVTATLVNGMELEVQATPVFEAGTLSWSGENAWPVADPPDRAQRVADAIANRTRRTLNRLAASMIEGAGTLRWDSLTVERGVIDISLVSTGAGAGFRVFSQDAINQMDWGEGDIQFEVGENQITANMDMWNVVLRPPAAGESGWTAEAVDGDVPQTVLDRLAQTATERFMRRQSSDVVVGNGQIIDMVDGGTTTRTIDVSLAQLRQRLNMRGVEIEASEGRLLFTTGQGTAILIPDPQTGNWLVEGDAPPQMAQRLTEVMTRTIDRVVADRFGPEADTHASSVTVGVTILGITVEVTVDSDSNIPGVDVGFAEDAEGDASGGNGDVGGSDEGDDGGDGEGGEVEP